MTGNHDKSLEGVQALRFVAAMLVVATHASLMVSERILDTGFLFWGLGRAGVDIFFIISGFVMMISSEKLIDRANGWRHFAARRILRIVPMYWVATTLKLVAVLLVPAATPHSGFDPFHTIASYLFIPARNPVGEIMPMLAVGWTLVLEMGFYVIFTIALLTGQAPLRFATAVFCLFAALALIMPDDAPVAALVYFDPLLLEFVFGMLVARIWSSGLQIRPWLAAALLVSGFVLLAVLQPLAFSEAYVVSPRFLAWGLPAMMVVMGTVYLEPVLRKVLPKLALSLGDASYSLYLFHGLLVPFLGVMMAKMGLIWPVTAFIVAMVASAVMSLFVYRLVEAPTTRWLRARVEPRLASGSEPPGKRRAGRLSAL